MGGKIKKEEIIVAVAVFDSGWTYWFFGCSVTGHTHTLRVCKSEVGGQVSHSVVSGLTGRLARPV